MREKIKAALAYTGLLPVLRKMKSYCNPEIRGIERDLRVFRRRFASVLNPLPEGKEGVFPGLIIGIHGFIPSIKLEGFWAKSLQLENYRPVVLLHRYQSQVREYYEVFGVRQFVFMEDFLRDDYDQTIERQISAFFSSTPSLRDIVNFQYHQAEVGKHAISWIMRIKHTGTLDFSDPDIIGQFKDMFRNGMRAVHAAERIFDTVNPALALFNERGYTPYGEIFDISLLRRVNTIQFVASHLDQSYHFKRYTLETRSAHPISLCAENWQHIKEKPLLQQQQKEFVEEHYYNYKVGNWYSRVSLQTGKKIISKQDVQKTLGLDPTKKTAVIFPHILWDSVFFYGVGIFDDYGQWLVETIKAACKNDKVNWVLKAHPLNVWRLAADGFHGELAEHVLVHKYVGQLPEHIKVLEPDSDINTASLFESMDYCITVRGTIGMESPMFGIPVLTAGTSRYSECGFTINSESIPEYLDKLGRIQEFTPLSEEQIEWAIKHAHAIFKLRPLTFDTFRVSTSRDPRYPKFLNPQIELNPEIKTPGQLWEAKDLKKFGDWAANSRNPDYLAI